MAYFLFLFNVILMIIRCICCVGFVVLYVRFGKKMYAWCSILFVALMIDTILLNMAEFLPGFEVFYNSKVESEPFVRSTLIVTYLLCYRMILKHGIRMTIPKWEYMVIAGLVLLIPATALFPLTPIYNLLYNSYTWCYTLCFFGASIYFCLRHMEHSKWRRPMLVLLCAMFVLEGLAYLETVQWLRHGAFYLEMRFPLLGQRPIFTGLIGTVLDGVGLWFVVWSIYHQVCSQPSSVQPSPQAIKALCAAYKLTPREEEILLCLTCGQKNVDIAQQLHISLGTVKAHTHNIFTKVEIQSRDELMDKLARM